MNGERMVTILTPPQLIGDQASSYSLLALGTVLLLLLLALRELAASAEGGWHGLARSLNVAIIPLLMVFFVSISVVIAHFVSSLPSP